MANHTEQIRISLFNECIPWPGLLSPDDTRELQKKPQIEARLAKLEAGNNQVSPEFGAAQ